MHMSGGTLKNKIQLSPAFLQSGCLMGVLCTSDYIYSQDRTTSYRGIAWYGRAQDDHYLVVGLETCMVVMGRRMYTTCVFCSRTKYLQNSLRTRKYILTEK